MFELYNAGETCGGNLNVQKKGIRKDVGDSNSEEKERVKEKWKAWGRPFGPTPAPCPRDFRRSVLGCCPFTVENNLPSPKVAFERMNHAEMYCRNQQGRRVEASSPKMVLI